VEWAVLEVGLRRSAGRYNVVHPAVGRITSLSYDHVELLGHTSVADRVGKGGDHQTGRADRQRPTGAGGHGCDSASLRRYGCPAPRDREDWIFEGNGGDLTGQTFTTRHFASLESGAIRTSTLPNALSDLHIPSAGPSPADHATTARRYSLGAQCARRRNPGGRPASGTCAGSLARSL